MFDQRRRIFLQLILAVILSFIGCSASADSLHDHAPILQSASELDYPPFSIVEADGTANGFSVELLKAVVQATNLQVNVAVGPWHEIKQQLATGRLDVLPLVSHSPERDKVFDFSIPYLQMHGAVFVREGEQSIVDVADLKDKEVLVMRDDTAHEYALRHKLSTKLILTSTFKEAMQLLSSGKHDAVFCQYVMGLQLIKQLGIKNIVSLPIENETNLRPRAGMITGFEQKFSMAVPEGRKELLAHLNEGLAIVSANGTYDKIYQKWFGPILPTPAISLQELIKYLFFVCTPILLLFAAIGLFYLKREVVIQVKQAEKEKMILESQLRQSHKMEAIGTLAGGIAHDFNNILAAIIGYADMALEDTPASSPAKGQIEQVVIAGNRAKELVKQILAFSRKEAYQVRPLRLHRVVCEALDLLRASIPPAIRIQQNIDEKSGTILADPTQVHQIVMNLCTNAIQAMRDEKGFLQVSVTAKTLETDSLAGAPHLVPGPYVHLSVADDGIGIDREHVEKIFDPYFTTKDIGKGSGLGLAVVAGIVKSGNGVITVDSTFGKGTRFDVYFPRCTEAAPEELKKDGPVPCGKEKILVVDDEEVIGDMIRIMVERLGYQATSLTSSVEALAVFQAEPNAFDLVITDQTMPEMTGEQLAANLKKVRPELPIILCTGNISRIDQPKVPSSVVSLLLLKPVPIKELAEAIRRVLDKS